METYCSCSSPNIKEGVCYLPSLPPRLVPETLSALSELIYQSKSISSYIEMTVFEGQPQLETGQQEPSKNRLFIESAYLQTGRKCQKKASRTNVMQIPFL